MTLQEYNQNTMVYSLLNMRISDAVSECVPTSLKYVVFVFFFFKLNIFMTDERFCFELRQSFSSSLFTALL